MGANAYAVDGTAIGANGTIFNLDFDFTSQNQKDVLEALQAGNYSLLGYLGASGSEQVTAGVPIWFAQPFKEMLGTVDIQYQPQYQVYIFNQGTIGVNTHIKADAHSTPVGLGTSLNVDQTGTFGPGAVDVLPNSIALTNNMPATHSAVTVGLAALVNGVYQPFCAFTSTPGSTVQMTPDLRACLFAANTNLKSGSVTAKTVAPGCEFIFADQSVYTFAIEAGSYQVHGTGQTNTTPLASDKALTNFLNNNGNG